MKTLKQYIGNYIETYTNESLLDDEDTFLDPERDEMAVLDWIKKHYKISNAYNIFYDDYRKIFTIDAERVQVNDLNITSLTNDLFEWGEVNHFYCSNCKNLKSLEGGPKEVKFVFCCSLCDSLTDLKGAPKEILSGHFYCDNCKNLRSLKGAPKKVMGNFYCYNCEKLSTLEGSPKFVNGSFNCSHCKKLKTLKGMPKRVDLFVQCMDCPNLVITREEYEKYDITL